MRPDGGALAASAGGSGWLCTGATGAASGGPLGGTSASDADAGWGLGAGAWDAASGAYCGLGMVSGGGPRVSSALVG
jgi:hypothetical protein